nr:MAG TPA: virion morphogenesis protein [Caudoviricetes sp.]
MSSVNVKVDGDVQRLMKRLGRIASVDKAGINNAIAEGLRTSTIERFQTEKSPEGKKWKQSVRARNEGGKTLTKSSTLRTSIRSEASADGLAVGTNDIRAATHQFGDTRIIKAKRKKVLRFQINGRWVSKKEVKVTIPARPFLGVSEEDEEEIKKLLGKALEEA